MRYYGQLSFDRAAGQWRIGNLSPHVAIALKRLFPRIPRTATEITLSDTDEVRADLDWFMMRYPLDHDHPGTVKAGARRIAARAAERDRILLPTWTPTEVAGFREGKAPFVYQSQAAAIALGTGSLLVGDDAGLGKTITAATIATGGAPLPAAVLCDAHLCGQWSSKLEEFTHLRVHVVKARSPYNLPPADVFIFSWAKSIGWVDLFKSGFLRTVIWDEIQELRTGTTATKGVVSMQLAEKAELRVGLTATPVYNYGDEMHTVMGYIKPGLLGDREEFMREWCGGSRIVRDPDALGSYLRDTGYFLRRTEDDPSVISAWGHLPPINQIEIEVDHDTAAVADERKLARTLALQVVKGSFVEAGRAARELDVMMRLITGVAKARAVAAYVRMLLQDSERVLVAAWHREVYEILKAELAAFDPVLYTGSESAAGKARSIEAFTRGRSRVMFMSLRSGKGVDGLQGYCTDAVVGELDWSPQVHYQFFRRLRRPGMDPLRPVTGHYVHTDFGSDPVLIETLGIKADQARGINDPGIAPKQTLHDDRRIRRLAEHVLNLD